MLDKKELGKMKDLLGFNLGQIEKDYLQSLFLLFLSRNTENDLVFKGGTALQKCYGLNRFSEDLDFTLVKETDLDKIIKKTSENLKAFGFEAEYAEFKSRSSKNYKLRIKGPLFDGTERSISSLRIEISLRNDLVLEPDLKEIIPVYADTQPIFISVMNIQEILAEKVRTLLQRQKARDVYDLWFLLRKGAKLDYELIGKKAELLNLKFDTVFFLKRISEIEKVWQTELSGYVTTVPDFNKVINEIKSYFKKD